MKREKRHSKTLVWLYFSLFLVSCTHYSTVERPEPQNIINAPIDVVWEKTLAILPTERIDLKIVDKPSYMIVAKKQITLWSWGDQITIKLIPKGEDKTLMQFQAESKNIALDFGHSGRMVKDIFNRIKIAAEHAD